MPYNGSGGFTRVRNWVSDAAANIKIRSDYHDAHDDDFASGLSNCVTKDGQTNIIANIPMNGYKITNLGAPVNPTDATTKTYVDSLRTFSTALTLSGAAPESSIRFTAADIGFGAREAGNPVGYNSRWVWNDKPDMSGTDVAVMDDKGHLALLGATLPLNNNKSAIFSPNDITIGGALAWNEYSDLTSSSWKAAQAFWSAHLLFDPGNGSLYLQRSNAAATAAGATVAHHDLLSFSSGNTAKFAGSVFFANDDNFYAAKPSSDATQISFAAGKYFQYTVSTDRFTIAGAPLWVTSLIVNNDSNFYFATVGGQKVWSVSSGVYLGWIAASNTWTFAGAADVDVPRLSVGGDINFGLSVSGGTKYLSWAAGSYISYDASANTSFATPSGVNLISGNDGTLTIRGQAYKPGGGGWQATSDERVKTVAGDYTQGLDDILQLRPVRYVYKGNDTREAPDERTASAPYWNSPNRTPAENGTEYVGLVAQEVEAIFPAMVSKRAGYIDGEPVTDLRDLDTSALIFALINSVKELSAKVAALEAAK